MHHRASAARFALLLSLTAGVVLGAWLFAGAFFPAGISVPGQSEWQDFRDPATWLRDAIGNERRDDDEAGYSPPEPAFDRLVLVLVDALRADFLLGHDAQKRMPFAHQLMNSAEALGWMSRAESPTVTLPRLKAMLAGVLPGYFDIIRNFDSPAFEADSIIAQMRSHGKRLVFYGDETWLRLFPTHFARSDTTNSFFVSDYTIVDDNVTRHLDAEAQATDWDALVLHYLGVDHIGHVHGPYSDVMKRKLMEMDGILMQLYRSIVADAKRKTLLVVVSEAGGCEGGLLSPLFATREQ